MIGIELVRDMKKRPADKEASRVKEELMHRGFIIGVGGLHKNVLRLDSPLMITKEQRTNLSTRWNPLCVP